MKIVIEAEIDGKRSAFVPVAPVRKRKPIKNRNNEII
jgi:hypothetical protein